MKAKHNKKRNTAFIFEALIREMATAMVHRDNEKKEQVSRVIQEHFKRGSTLDKELQCYRALHEESGADNYTAEKIIHRAKQQYGSLDKKQIFKEQSAVISKINKTLGAGVFSNFVPNYRTFATISQIFSDKTPVKQKVLMERQILRIISKEKQKEEEVVPVDNLVVKSFSQRYNDQYQYLLPEQKNLLAKYILAFGDNDADFRVALAEELHRIYAAIETSLHLPEVSSDKVMIENTKKVMEDVKSFSVAEIGEKELRKILKLQNLVNEYTHDAANN